MRSAQNTYWIRDSQLFVRYVYFNVWLWDFFYFIINKEFVNEDYKRF